MVKGKSAKPKGKGNKKKTRKDKIHGEVKGKKGTAAAYITRAQALVKLQVPLADFRRLCILKGIYPRDPKKKTHGQDKTYYHKKDISFLSHEPLLEKFFQLKTFLKKFKRLIGRGEQSLASSMEKNKPKYTLHHLVRERYPNFEDAIRDLDDAVSTVALFATLPADHLRDIPADAVSEATRLYEEFQLCMIRNQTLRKVFASIKGYYFQVEVCGTQVTWLAPHQFAQALPPEVDFKVMLTFLEFYRCMLKFVNFKLYADLGLAYPPKRDKEKAAAQAEVAALELEMREAGSGQKDEAAMADEDAAMAADVANEFGAQSQEAMEVQRQQEEIRRTKTVFKGMRVFINREVPLRPLYFTLLCGGVAEVGWERGALEKGGGGPGSAFRADDPNITHHIVDRPPEHLEIVEGREYVQPQWVFDSFNTKVALPIAPYAPGRTPPPHLSPFVDDKAEGYIPRQREILDQFAAEAAGASGAGEEGSAGAGAATAPGTSKATAFEKFNEELQAEIGGKWHSEFKEEVKEKHAQMMEEQKDAILKPAAPQASIWHQDPEEQPKEPKAAFTEEEEQNLNARAIMRGKHRKLLRNIEHNAKKKTDATTRLQKKRRALEKAGEAS
mmetsp:Transcript_54498/g.129931  ORF Transcript_54498/g.129931 Transcript_54498/m.129931 type:complete len:613 (+) Transcript_54498:62-1900(+)